MIVQIFDSSAIIAFFNRENGVDIVENILLDKQNHCFVHAINLCEVYYDAIRRRDETYAERIVNDLILADVIVRNDFDQDFWKDVARLKAKYRASLADFCGIVLANNLSGTFVTADHHELDKIAVDKVCAINFIR